MLPEALPQPTNSSGGCHLWARGYFAVASGTITDAMAKEYIAEQEGELVQDDGRFRFDDSPALPRSRR
jgi:putative transposase